MTSIILDMSHYRLFKPVKSDVPAENPKHFMKIKFLHKGIDAINLPQLLRSQSVVDKIPAYFKDKEPPIISYQYTNTVANKLFNFSSTLSNLDITNYLSNPQHCQCNTSKFCYEPHGHVVTGDFMVIENVKLRELVAKGPKYREPNKINWQSTETMVSNSNDLYAEQWSKREQVDLKYLSEWKDQINELVVERISSLKEKIRSPKLKILSDPDVKDTLRRLHDDFVLVPADKAANNVIVVCKKYYIETLIKESGINTTNISPNSTYIPSTDSFHEILKSHCKFIESVGLEMSEEDENLPYLYWTPKLHKVPFKHRFIASSSKCTTKDLSCLLTTVKDGLIRYNNTKTSHNGVNSMWIVKTPQACCHPWTNWMSVQQHQFRHMTFPPCTHQSHTICLSLELLHLYTTHSRGEMEVTDTPTSKLRVERGISWTPSILVEIICTLQIRYSEWWSF